MPLPVAHGAAGLSIFIAAGKGENVRDNKILAIYCILLSVVADFDFLPGFFAGQPHKFHHGPSHSLFVGCVAGLLAGIWLIKVHKVKIRKKIILICSVMSAASHPVLDLLSADQSSPFGVPLFWPFSDTYHISARQLFLSIDKSGSTFNSFVQSMMTINNAKEVVIEVVFALVVIGIAFTVRKRATITKMFSRRSCSRS